MACIYALYSSSDPSHIRYVGRSQFDTPDIRLKTHIQEAKKGRKHKSPSEETRKKISATLIARNALLRKAKEEAGVN